MIGCTDIGKSGWGEQYKDLGTMASPQELTEAMTTIGLLKRPFTKQELAREIKRAGGAALLRVELVNALLGATLHQMLMATNAAADAGADPVRITAASDRVLSGINIDTGEPGEQKVLGTRMLAGQLQHLLMVLTAECRKGDNDIPLLVMPAMLASTGVHALLEAATGDDRNGKIREAIDAFTGTKRSPRHDAALTPAHTPPLISTGWPRQILSKSRRHQAGSGDLCVMGHGE